MLEIRWKVKKDIQESKVDALSVINSILHRSFKWKDNDGTEEIGYIAQELENVKSNFVFKVPQRDEDGNILDEVYQIDETKIIPFITKAIQELSSELEEQKAINKFLLKELGLEYKYKLSKTGEKVENLIVDALKDKIKQYDNQSIKFKEYIQEKREVMRKLVKQDDDSTTIILEEAKDEKNS